MGLWNPHSTRRSYNRHAKHFVHIIWNIITDAKDYILAEYPDIILEGHPTANYRLRLPKEITFSTSEELHAKYPENPRFRTIVAQLKHRGLEHEMDLPFPFCTAVASESLLYSYCYCELRIWWGSVWSVAWFLIASFLLQQSNEYIQWGNKSMEWGYRDWLSIRYVHLLAS